MAVTEIAATDIKAAESAAPIPFIIPLPHYGLRRFGASLARGRGMHQRHARRRADFLLIFY
jgi:hypothetical protein